MKLLKLIGLSIKDIRGNKTTAKITKERVVYVKPEIILFSDGITILFLQKQDPHDYHDFDSSARCFSIVQDEELWEEIIENEKGEYPPTNFDYNLGV